VDNKAAFMCFYVIKLSPNDYPKAFNRVKCQNSAVLRQSNQQLMVLART